MAIRTARHAADTSMILSKQWIDKHPKASALMLASSVVLSVLAAVEGDQQAGRRVTVAQIKKALKDAARVTYEQAALDAGLAVS